MTATTRHVVIAAAVVVGSAVVVNVVFIGIPTVIEELRKDRVLADRQKEYDKTHPLIVQQVLTAATPMRSVIPFGDPCGHLKENRELRDAYDHEASKVASAGQRAFHQETAIDRMGDLNRDVVALDKEYQFCVWLRDYPHEVKAEQDLRKKQDKQLNDGDVHGYDKTQVELNKLSAKSHVGELWK